MIIFCYLNRFNSFWFEEILEVITSGPIYDKYINLYYRIPRFYLSKPDLFMIINKDIDFIEMARPTKWMFPTPNWKHLKLSINQNDKYKSMDKLFDFINIVPKDCKVSLCITLLKNDSQKFIDALNYAVSITMRLIE